MLELSEPGRRVVEYRSKLDGSRRDEAGVALLLAVILLLFISAIGLGALQSAQSEATAGGRSARKVRTLFAADSGLQLVRDQLNIDERQYPDITAVDDTQFMQNRAGLYTEVRTGTGNNALAQEIRFVGRARRDGDQLNINAGNTFSTASARERIPTDEKATPRAAPALRAAPRARTGGPGSRHERDPAERHAAAGQLGLDGARHVARRLRFGDVPGYGHGPHLV